MGHHHRSIESVRLDCVAHHFLIRVSEAELTNGCGTVLDRPLPVS
jgi:hypothetical protein